jgi:uncharacterized protein involved in exopolysaccharide biosynthesis
VFGGIFLLVVSTGELISFMLPKAYQATARIIVTPLRLPPDSHGRKAEYDSLNVDPYEFMTQFEVIQSDAVLRKVIAKLNLDQQWRGESGKIHTPEALRILRDSLTLRRIRNTSIVEIRVLRDKPAEAAAIANAVTDAYLECRMEQTRPAGGAPNSTAEIVDRGVPNYRPARPNKPLMVFVSVVVGILLGSAVGVRMAFFAGRNLMNRPAAA